MAGTRNPFGRRPHPGFRIHLTSRQLRLPKNRRQRNLGKAVWRATLTANENRRESFRYRQISASSGAFFLSAFQFSAFQLYPNPPFPRNPHFPALQSTPRLRQAGRSDPLALSGASRRKQIPSSARLHNLMSSSSQGADPRYSRGVFALGTARGSGPCVLRQYGRARFMRAIFRR